MMDWYGSGMGTGGWAFMIAAMTIFWAFVIVAGVMMFRGDSGRRAGTATQDPGALEILDNRFARGEIDRDEYKARKAALRGGVH